ncbi:hypothetical protein B0J18DRAFT_243696 [Chaetomium sp. MPI-SDFR-AT-0129]|nr:hypothetical protein B0J18DRAFT_243696 [Chaetomium sp. MPI-SDFR-AT-0129]
MTSLPLKIRVGVREHWTKEDSPLQTTLRDLQALLGHKVVVEPEWPLLADKLDAFYTDKTTLVVVVAGCIQTWARCMFELLEDPVNEDWTEKVLEKVPVRMDVFVEVSATDNATTTWSEHRGGFIVELPNKLVSLPAELFPVFQGQLLECFDPVTKKLQLPERGATAAAGDDWEGVEVDTATGRPKVVESTTKSSAAEFMPDAASLPRPNELFLRPPYHLTLLPGHQQIELHGSHSPTLEFIATYLKRWSRVNHTDTRKPAGVQVTLHQSSFGQGGMFDRLTLSTEHNRYTNEFVVTSPLIVSLIEGVLGYRLVSAHEGWSFRRDVEFKKL